MVGKTRERSRREPDGVLAGGDGVAYRYILDLPETENVAEIFRILRDVSMPFRYLLLVPGEASGGCLAYLGLGSSDVLDLPFRLAAAGVRIRRGEKVRDAAR